MEELIDTEKSLGLSPEPWDGPELIHARIPSRELIIVRGIPGAGKSTLAKVLADVILHAFYFDVFPPEPSRAISEDDFWTNPTTGEYRFAADTRDDAFAYLANVSTIEMGRGLPFVIIHTAALDFSGKHWARILCAAKRCGYRVWPIVLQRPVSNPASIHNVSPDEMDRFRMEMEHGLEVNL